MKSPVAGNEFKGYPVTVIETPARCKQGFQQALALITQRILDYCSNVALIVQPNLRQKADKSLWIRKWNQSQTVPFYIHQTCSCQMGNGVQGAHIQCYVGMTWDPMGEQVKACSSPPTLTTSQLSLSKDNLDEFDLTGIPPAPASKGVPQIEVTFDKCVCC